MSYTLEDIKDIPTDGYKNMEDFISSLSGETGREFEIQLTCLAKESDMRLLQYIPKDLQADDRGFAYFVLKATYFRRHKDYSEMRMYVNEYQQHFQDRAFYWHLKSMAYLIQVTEETIFLEGLAYIKKAVEFDESSSHIGILHNYSEAVVTGLEEYPGQTKEMLSEKEIRSASGMIDQVLEKDPSYPKFYCTKGRWEAAFHHNFTSAKKHIEKAIDMESSKEKNYALRIGDYQRYMLKVELQEAKMELDDKNNNLKKQLEESKNDIKEQQETLKQQVEQSKQKLETMKSDNMKILGFFTAFLSLVVGSISIVGTQDFLDAALLIMVLGGVLLFSFAGFFFLHSRSHAKYFFITIAVCILMIGSSFGLYMMLQGPGNL